MVQDENRLCWVIQPSLLEKISSHLLLINFELKISNCKFLNCSEFEFIWIWILELIQISYHKFCELLRKEATPFFTLNPSVEAPQVKEIKAEVDWLQRSHALRGANWGCLPYFLSFLPGRSYTCWEMEGEGKTETQKLCFLSVVY